MEKQRPILGKEWVDNKWVEITETADGFGITIDYFGLPCLTQFATYTRNSQPNIFLLTNFGLILGKEQAKFFCDSSGNFWYMDKDGSHPFANAQKVPQVGWNVGCSINLNRRNFTMELPTMLKTNALDILSREVPCAGNRSHDALNGISENFSMCCTELVSPK